MPRGLVEAVVQTSFGPLRVMTTHLEYYSQTQRAAQLEAVRARHAEACAHALDDRARSDTGDPFQAQPQTLSAILTGDFNFRADDPLHARMTAPYDDARVPAWDDAWQRLHPRDAQPATIGVHDCDQWPDPFACDFIFTTRDLGARLRSVAVDSASAASDHQPVLVELA
jgi:endonuclease/exonuclease/phosphatase family metal-dependent hydrolase